MYASAGPNSGGVTETIAQIMLNLERPSGGIHISEPAQQVTESSLEAKELDPKDKGKGILKETKKKKKKITLAQLREIEIAKNEEAARRQQDEYDAEYLEEVKKSAAVTKRSMTVAQERNWMISFLSRRGYKNLQRLRYPDVKILWDAE